MTAESYATQMKPLLSIKSLGKKAALVEIEDGVRGWKEVEPVDRQKEEGESDMVFTADVSWEEPFKKKSNIYMIVGPPNSGKSTFARFLVNRKFGDGDLDHVYCLDIDVGQPNFTLPGQVSLLKLSDT